MAAPARRPPRPRLTVLGLTLPHAAGGPGARASGAALRGGSGLRRRGRASAGVACRGNREAGRAGAAAGTRVSSATAAAAAVRLPLSARARSRALSAAPAAPPAAAARSAPGPWTRPPAAPAPARGRPGALGDAGWGLPNGDVAERHLPARGPGTSRREGGQGLQWPCGSLWTLLGAAPDHPSGHLWSGSPILEEPRTPPFTGEDPGAPPGLQKQPARWLGWGGAVRAFQTTGGLPGGTLERAAKDGSPGSTSSQSCPGSCEPAGFFPRGPAPDSASINQGRGRTSIRPQAGHTLPSLSFGLGGTSGQWRRASAGPMVPPA